jgi:hypothetical protein
MRRVAFILFPAVLGTILCALDGGYGGGCSWGEAKAIAHLTFIGFLFAFIPCFPAVYSQPPPPSTTTDLRWC